MNCPHCGVWSRVLETRAYKTHKARRYECANLHRFSTSETVQPASFLVRPNRRGLPQVNVQEPPVPLLLDPDAPEPGINR